MGLFDGLEQYRPQLPQEQDAKPSGLFSGLEKYRPQRGASPWSGRNLGFDFDQILSDEGTRPELASAFAGQESGWNPNARSVDKARGLFQVIPDTFKRFAKPGERYDNPADVARVGARMLAKFDRDYGGDVDRIAVAHFSGEGNVAPPGYATPWLKDTADGNGKRVSQYVPDIRKRLGGQPKAAGRGEIIPIDDPNPRPIDPAQGQPDRGEFKKGWLAQIMGGTPSAAGQVVQGLADIAFEQDNALGQRLQALGKRLEAMSEEEFRKYQGKVDSLKDVGEADDVLDGLSKLGDFVAYAGGSGAASLAQIGAGAGAGALLGAPAGPFGATAGAIAGGFTTSYLLAYGEARKTALSDPQIQQLIKDGKIRTSDVSLNARGAATVVAALDMLGAERILGAVFRQAKQDLIRRAVLGGITGGAAEGGTEGLQTLVTEWFRQYMGSDIPTDWKKVIDSVAGGVVVGTPVGTATSAASRPAKTDAQKANPYWEDRGEQPVSGTEGLGQEVQEQPEAAGAAGVEQEAAAPPAVPALTPQAAQEELANIEASLIEGEPVPPELQARIDQLQQATQDLAAAPQADAAPELPVEQPPPDAEQVVPPPDPVAQAADAIRAEMGVEPVHQVAEALEEMTPSATERVQAPEPAEPPAVPESQVLDAVTSGNLPDVAALPDAGLVEADEMAQPRPEPVQEQASGVLESVQERAPVVQENVQSQPVAAPRPSMLIARELAGARLPARLPGSQWEAAIAQGAPNLLNRMRKSGAFEWAAAQDTLSKDDLIARLTPAKASEEAPKRLRRLDKLIDILEKVRACVRSGALNDCLAKAGKALLKAQVDDVRARAARLRKAGMGPQQAAEAAISDLIGELMAERAELMGEIRAAGGTAADRAVPPAAPASQPVAPVSGPVGDNSPANAAQESQESQESQGDSLQDTPLSRAEPTLSEVPELPKEERTEPTLSPKEVERFTGMYRKGMREQNAREAMKRLAKKKPDLDWQVEADEQFGPDRFSVVGYTKAEPKAAESETTQAIAETKSAESEAKAAEHESMPSEVRQTIQDVGEKIGGARKDTSVRVGARNSAPKDDTPGWRKRYTVSQIVKDSKAGEEGRWVINDSRNKDWMGQPRQIGNSFATKEEADAAVPIVEVARNHRVGYTKDEGGAEKYVIWRNVTDRKRVQVVQQLFDSDADAKRYMAEHAVEIIETKTSFGEEILPRPDNVRREGPQRRKGSVKGEDFLRDFGFRAVEFGNWEAQDERQTVMNHAYDALMDLADVLGVPPAALGLNGELALAFGARGQGLSGARAHYERDYGVINLTKMSGAGSLAHEWMHAADHYFGRQDGKASSVKKRNERGDMVFDAKGRDDDYASHGTSRDSKMRAELKTAYDAVIDTISYKAEQYVEDTQKADRFVAEAREGVAGRLQRIRDGLSSALELGPKAKRAPASAEQLARFDEIAQKIIDGEYLELELRKRPGSKAKWGGYQLSNDGLDALSALYKEVRGRAGMTKQGGPIAELAGAVERYGARLKMLADAQAQTTKTRKLPTTFATEAKRIDQGRASDYWSTPHEMLARAFQSYVEDRVADRGGKSDFLTYGTNTVVPTPWGWARPFPTGSEREAINAAFDKFVEVLDTKETEHGTAMFSRSDDVTFAQEVLNEDANVVARAYLELAEDDDLFIYKRSTKFELPDIAAEVDHKLEINDARESAPSITGAKATWDVRMPDGSPAWVHLYSDGKLAIDASQLTSGHSAGSKLVHAVANYAFNRGLRLEGDRQSLTKQGRMRAAELMLSSALKFKTTRHLSPAQNLREPGPNGERAIDWRDGDHLHNITQLIEVTSKNVIDEIPDLYEARYNWDAERFEDKHGITITKADFQSLADRSPGARAQGAGGKTLARAVLVSSLVRPVLQGAGSAQRDGVLAGDAKLGNLKRRRLVKGTPLERLLYKRKPGQASGGMPRDALLQALLPVISGWQNGPRAVEVLQSYEDLPPALYRDAKEAGAIGPGSKLHGVYEPSTRTVYLIADTIPDARFGQFVLLHETMGHFGLRSILGKRYASTMKAIYDRNANVRKAADQQMLKYGYNLELAVEEVLADMAASGKPAWGWKQVLAGIMDWIRAQGWGDLANMIEKLTDAEALRLVGQARSFVEKGERPHFYRQEQVPAFARKDGGGGAVFSRSTRRPWMESMPAATQDALRKAGAWHDEPTLTERFKEWGADWRRRFRQGLFDQFAPIKELSYKAYMQLRLTRGADATLEAMLAYGTIEMDNDGAIDVNYEKGGFFGVLSKLEDEHDRFIAWVVGNRAERLKKEGRENNFTDEDIRRLKSLIQGNLPSGKPRLQAYSDALRQLNRYNRSVMDIAEKAGLIDPASRQFWEKDFYVPFYRVMDEAGNSNAPRNFGGAVNQYAFKVLKGGAKELGDPLHNMLLNWSHLIDASLKNQAARESLKEAEKQGIAIEADEATARQMAKAMGKKAAVVSVVDQGTRRWYLVDDPLVLDALRAIGFSGFQFQPLKLMGKFKRLLTFGVTIDPTFRIRNLIRDSLSMIGTNQANYNVLSNLVTGWKATREGEEAMGHLLAGGGLIRFGSLTEGDRAEHAKKLIQSGVEDKTVLDSQSKVSAMLQAGYDWWMHVGDRAENVNRAALYQKLRNDGKSHLEASYLTRDVMDFSLMGTWGAIRFLAQVVPFFNARMQGMYKLGRGAAEDPRRFAAVTGATALASVALLLAYKDDEDWKKREDWDRETSWWFKIGDTAYRIPKPFEIGVLASMVERGTEAMLTDELSGKQFAQRLGSMVWNQLSMNPIPQMFQPAIELWANKDFFTGRPIESAGMRRLSPSERSGANTSIVADVLGKNNVVSPAQVDHLIHGYLGWLGLAVTSTVDTFAREMPLGLPERPSMRLDDIPVLGSFAKDLPAYQSRYVTQLYDQARDAQQLMADIKHAQATGNLEKAKELASDRDKVTDAQALIRAERVLGQLNAQIRMVQMQRISAEQKRARLDRLYETRNRLAQITIAETRRSR